jgi:3-oxoacyl-[acyl-carrier protein] reductase
VLGLQLLAAAVLLAGAGLEPHTQAVPVFAVVVLSNLCSATQDIPTDAMTVEALGPADRGLGNGAQVAAMLAQATAALGGLDILVNNAGIMQVKPFLELTEADWDTVLNTNLKSMFLCCRAALPGMVAQGSGTIINIASELGYLGRELYVPYTASKGGVITLTRSLAREFAPKIRINGIAPGPTMTPMIEAEIAITGGLEAETATPAGRLGEPAEIASAAVYLASSHASFFYGEILSPNGGALMR